MVTVFLRGGLGNQMFQYALGLHLAKKNRTELILDTVHLSDRFPRKNFTYRTFYLDVFALEPRFTLLSKVAHAAPIPGVWLGLDLLSMEVRDAVRLVHVIREKGADFDPAVLEVSGNLLLFGRWQSEKYFLDVADEVRAAFQLKYPFEGAARSLAEKIASCNSVSLHVRRGDYAAFRNVERMMGKTDMIYYDRAVRYIGEHIRNPQIFIFSDDIAWCRANIKFPFPTTYADNTSHGPKDSWHMALMAQCKHNIVANSTFSWWGAWLNANPKKIIIVPKRWYADPKTAKSDIIPKRWIVL